MRGEINCFQIDVGREHGCSEARVRFALFLLQNHTLSTVQREGPMKNHLQLCGFCLCPHWAQTKAILNVMGERVGIMLIFKDQARAGGQKRTSEDDSSRQERRASGKRVDRTRPDLF